MYALTDEDENLAALYDYDAWGNILTEAIYADVDNKFNFSTREFSDVSGLGHWPVREYDSFAGRWTRVDPAMQYMNGYSYGGENPVNMVDYYGDIAEFKWTFDWEPYGYIKKTIGYDERYFRTATVYYYFAPVTVALTDWGPSTSANCGGTCRCWGKQKTLTEWIKYGYFKKIKRIPGPRKFLWQGKLAIWERVVHSTTKKVTKSNIIWFKVGWGKNTNTKLKRQCERDCYEKWVNENFPFAKVIIKGGHKAPYIAI